MTVEVGIEELIVEVSMVDTEVSIGFIETPVEIETTGPMGPKGPQGDKGDKGDKGDQGIPGEGIGDHEAAADPHPQYLTDAELAAALPPETDANSNTGYGLNTLVSTTTGTLNTSVGKEALRAITTGSRNTAVGVQASTTLDASNDSVAIGYLVQRLTTSSNNVGVGSQAHMALTTGANNVAVGFQALAGLTTGSHNVAVGYQALHAPKGTVANGSITTLYQIGIGYQAGSYLAGIGSSSVAIGYRAVTHNNAVALGATAEAQAASSVALGYGAIATLANQIMLGAATHRVYVNNDPVAALEVATKQYVDTKAPTLPPESDVGRNTGYGVDTKPFTAGALDNTAVGQSVLDVVSTGARNAGVGSAVLKAVTTGSNNVGLGYAAGTKITTGNSNFALGAYALDALTTGSQNLAIGYQALRGLVDVNDSIGIGTYALTAATGGPNVAIGASALGSLTTAYYNVAIGHNAMAAVTIGRYNVGIGYLSGNYGASTSTQDFNVYIGGHASAYTSGSGSAGTAVGFQTKAHTSATALGSYAEARGTNSTAVGTYAIATLDNQVMLGTASQNVWTPGTHVFGGPALPAVTATQDMGSTSMRFNKVWSTRFGNDTGSFFFDDGNSTMRMTSGNLEIGTRAVTQLTGLMFNTDNTGDIGAAANYRPRNIYVGTTVTVGRDPSAVLEVATKQYVDGKVTGGGPESDANLNTTYGTGALPSTAPAGVTAMGYNSLTAAGAGTNSTAFGVHTGNSMTSAADCTLIGNGAGGGISLGTGLTLIGHSAGVSLAGHNLGDAQMTTMIGRFAGPYGQGMGTQSVAIGGEARTNNYAIAIGFGAEARGMFSQAFGRYAIATLDNQIMLGTTAERVYAPGGFIVSTNLAIGKIWDGTYYGIQRSPTGTASANSPTILLGSDSVKTVHIMAGVGDSITLRPSFDPNKDWTFTPNDTIAKTPLVLPADPTTALQAATKQYVDAEVTVSASAPSGAPSRDGLLWVMYT